MYITGDAYILNQTDNVSQTLMEGNTAVETQLTKIRSDFQDRNYFLDVIFFAVLVNFVFTMTLASLRAKKEGVFSFIGLLTFGTAIFFFLMSIISSFRDWFLTNVFNVVLVNPRFTGGLITTFINNFEWFAVVMVFWILLINQVDVEQIINLRRRDRSEP